MDQQKKGFCDSLMKGVEKMKKIFLMSFSLVYLVTVFCVSPSEASGEANKKECIPMEAEVMSKSYEDNLAHSGMMYIFDVRSRSAMKNGKRIPMVMRISDVMFQSDAVYEIEDWKGKDIFLVGEDTESAVKACRTMIEKKYDVANIYVLKGGMKEWKGPVMTNQFKDVSCEGLSSPELVNIMNSNRKVDIVDLRSSKDYLDGHIPGAIMGDVFDIDKICYTSIFPEAVRNKGFVVFLGKTEEQVSLRCKSMKYGIGYENLYTLKGNMNDWKGPLEKGQTKSLHVGP